MPQHPHQSHCVSISLRFLLCRQQIPGNTMLSTPSANTHTFSYYYIYKEKCILESSPTTPPQTKEININWDWNCSYYTIIAKTTRCDGNLTWHIEFTACLWALDFSLLFPNLIFAKKRFRPLRVSTELQTREVVISREEKHNHEADVHL